MGLALKKTYSILLPKFAGAYVTGNTHLRNNTSCQDRIHSLTNNGIVCIALADGAGSSLHSDIGAEIVTYKICELMTNCFEEYWNKDKEILKKKLIGQLLTNLISEAENKKINVKEMASTLLFVAIRQQKFIAGHIGDGVIGVYKNNNLEVLSHPHNQEFINVTVFTTSSCILQDFKIYRGSLDNINGFVLMSDGSGESFYDKKQKKLAPAIIDILKWLDIYSPNEVSKAIEQNLQNIIKLKTEDDCSINVLRLVKQNIKISRPERRIITFLQKESSSLSKLTIRKSLKMRSRQMKKHLKTLEVKNIIMGENSIYSLLHRESFYG